MVFTDTATFKSQLHFHATVEIFEGCTFAPLMLSFIDAEQSCHLLDINGNMLANCLYLNNKEENLCLMGLNRKRDHYLNSCLK